MANYENLEVVSSNVKKKIIWETFEVNSAVFSCSFVEYLWPF